MSKLNAEFPERIHRPAVPWQKEGGGGPGDEGGPRRPDVNAPDTKELLKKMRRVDPNQAKRYRQRTGE